MGGELSPLPSFPTYRISNDCSGNFYVCHLAPYNENYVVRFLKLKTKNKVFEVWKKWRTLKYHIGSKMTKYFFQKLRLRASVSFFITNKSCEKESSLNWLESQWKKKSLRYEGSEELTFEISIWVKNNNLIFFRSEIKKTSHQNTKKVKNQHLESQFGQNKAD